MMNRNWVQDIENAKTKSDIIEILINCDNNKILNKAWEKLEGESPISLDILYIIEYCKNNEICNKAWEKLEKQNALKIDLMYIICTCDNNEVLNKVWVKFESEPHTNDELTDIICKCKNNEIRNKAWLELRSNLNITETINEEKVMQKVAKMVFQYPHVLNIKDFTIGIYNSIERLVCIVDTLAMDLEKEHGDKIASSVVIPSYAKMFYWDIERILDELKKIHYKNK